MSWDLLAYFPEEMITVNHTTYQDGAYDTAGKWIPGDASVLPIEIIAPQPVRADDLQQLRQGEEALDLLVSFSQTLVNTRDNEEDSDQIEFEGNQYKVLQVSRRAALGGFHRFIMGRKRGQV